MGVRWYLIVALICVSPMVSDVEHLLNMLVSHLYIILEKYLFRSFCLFSVTLFLLVVLYEFFIYSYIHPLSDMWFANIFSYSVGQYACSLCCFLFYFIFLKILFIFSKRGRKGEREGEKHWCERETLISCLLHTPNWGPGLQPRHVPWLGIETTTFWCIGWCSNQLSHPARVIVSFA